MIKKLHIFIVLFCVTAVSVAQNGWQQKASSPYGQLGAFYFSSGTKIYVAKSYGGTANDTLFAWEQATDTWSKIGAFPGMAKSSSAISCNGKAYVFCGAVTGGYTREVWEYTIATNTWIQKSNFPGAARNGHSLAFNSTNSKIYLSFGYGVTSFGNDYLSDLWEYNPATNTWVQKATYPANPVLSGRSSHKSSSAGNLLSVYWGATGQPTTFATGNVSVFDISTNTWVSTGTNSGTRRNSGALFTLGNNNFGGLGYYNINGYGSQDNSDFSIFGFPGQSRFGVVSVACNGKGYIGFGGRSSTPYDPMNPSIQVNELWEFNPLYSVNDFSTTAAGTALNINLLANDKSYATSFAPASFAVLSLPQNGTATGVLNNNTITYTPNAGFSGTDTIKYTICDSLGNCDTARIYITVNAPAIPTLQVSASQGTVCQGQGVTLTASGFTSYAWEPGSLSGSAIIVSPSVTTVYTVTASTPFSTQTQTITVTVNQLPAFSLSASLYTVCSGNTTTLTASGATSYTWMPGNNNSGMYVVSPIATTVYSITGESNGCSATGTIEVTVAPIPVITASASNTAPLCPGQSVTLTASGGASYTWQPGNLFGQSITVAPTASVIYTITGANAMACASDATIALNVATIPALTISASSPSVCPGSSVTLTASGGTSYTWQPGNFSGQSTTIVPTSPVIYTVTGQNNSGCAADATVAVNITPVPALTVSVSSPSVCTGNSVMLTASGAGSYTWQPGNMQTAGYSIVPAVTTVYTVSALSNGCSVSATTEVTVSSRADFGLVISPSTTLCSAQPVTVSVNGAYSAYSLNTTGFTSNIVITPALTAYTVFASGGASGCSTYSVLNFQTAVAPTLSLVTANSLCDSCTGSLNAFVSGGLAPYHFSMGGNLLSVPVSTLCQGLYNLTVTDSLGCSSHKIFSIACSGVLTGIADNSSNNAALIYPNPASSQLTIEHPTVSFNYSICNTMGQLILNGLTNEGKATISLDGFAKGVYFVELNSNEGTVRKKIIIE